MKLIKKMKEIPGKRFIPIMLASSLVTTGLIWLAFSSQRNDTEAFFNEEDYDDFVSFNHDWLTTITVGLITDEDVLEERFIGPYDSSENITLSRLNEPTSLEITMVQEVPIIGANRSSIQSRDAPFEREHLSYHSDDPHDYPGARHVFQFTEHEPFSAGLLPNEVVDRDLTIQGEEVNLVQFNEDLTFWYIMNEDYEEPDLSDFHPE